MPGYSQETVAGLIESAVARFTRRAEGSTSSSASLIDLQHGWAQIGRRARIILSRYVASELPPPAIDVEMAQAEIKRKQELGELHHRESREIRETLALRSLSGRMSRKPKPEARFYEAHHAHGACEVCGRDISIGDRYRGQRHEECTRDTQAVAG